ncbi:MAG: L,D-transpeptidase [Polyangiaceae bacterium]|nr:L,D-transpeptidase [Polyangiaceae bacterium]MCW5789060.1 L,D-transpeptidase [Polyangiaceae bacterium]
MAAVHRCLPFTLGALMALACRPSSVESGSEAHGEASASRTSDNGTELRQAKRRSLGKPTDGHEATAGRGTASGLQTKSGTLADARGDAASGAEEPGPASGAEPHIYALDVRVFIRARPSLTAAEVGALRIGHGVRTTGPAKPTGDCPAPGGFYPVAPEGYVCLDRTTTTDPAHPLVVARQDFLEDFNKDFTSAPEAPLRFGESIETPIYSRIPTESEQARSEYELERHLAAVRAVREAAAEGKPPPPRPLWRLRGASAETASGEPPSFLRDHQDSPWHAALGQPGRARLGFVPPRSTVSFIDEFTAGGRSFLMTPELTVVPKDKVRELRPSGFQGVRLDGSSRLPLAFFRSDETRTWRLSTAVSRTAGATGTAVTSGPTPSALGASSDTVSHTDNLPRPDQLTAAARVRVAATRVSDDRVSDDRVSDDGAHEPDSKAQGAAASPFTDDAQDAARLTPDAHRFERLGSVGLTGRARWQRGRRYLETRQDGLWVAQDEVAVVTEQRLRGVTLAPNERWIDVSIFQGTLTAYEGERPVFATLISPGASGYKPRRGPDRKNTTPTGTFRIEWKHLSTTMSPDPERRRYYLTDVPFTQFFHMPFALHAAYWHDRFGEPMSGGCVNLSITDARWLFDFTSPSLPEGWHSVRSGGDRGEGTWVSIR